MKEPIDRLIIGTFDPAQRDSSGFSLRVVDNLEAFALPE